MLFAHFLTSRWCTLANDRSDFLSSFPQDAEVQDSQIAAAILHAELNAA
jgi:hypothetical protein